MAVRKGQEEASHKLDRHAPYVTDDPVFLVHEYNVDIRVAHIYLFGEENYVLTEKEDEEPGVEYSMASRLIKNINILMRKPKVDKILIHMKTCGGDWHEGMAIYDVIKACPTPIVILNYTHARSMSSIILQAADKRVMMPHSYFMIHEGEGNLGGTEKQIRSLYEFYRRTADKQMIDIYADAMKEKGKLSKKPISDIKKWIRKQMNDKEEFYLTAKEAVEYGFADEVFGADGTYDWKKLVEDIG